MKGTHASDKFIEGFVRLSIIILLTLLGLLGLWLMGVVARIWRGGFGGGVASDSGVLLAFCNFVAIIIILYRHAFFIINKRKLENRG